MSNRAEYFKHPVQLAEYHSPIGPMTLAAYREGLCGAWFAGQKYFPVLPGSQMQDTQAATWLNAAARWLDRYFAGESLPPPCGGRLALAPEGTAFQRRVWRLLCSIPYGQTTTYGALAAQVAAELGRPRFSAQAVGGAVGRNPIALLIPCHRVVGANGSLTGYAGGLDRKAWLLRQEGNLPHSGSDPIHSPR